MVICYKIIQFRCLRSVHNVLFSRCWQLILASLRGTHENVSAQQRQQPPSTGREGEAVPKMSGVLTLTVTNQILTVQVELFSYSIGDSKYPFHINTALANSTISHQLYLVDAMSKSALRPQTTDGF